MNAPTSRFSPCLTLALLAVGFLTGGCASLPPNTLATHNSSGWEKEIAAFEAADRTNRPASNGIVFVGSSSIRLWKTLAADFPGLPVVNRGFGGSQLADSVNLAERIIIPYQPRQVVVYAGVNDINAGKTPELVYGDFVALMTKLRERLPHARLSFISVSTSPSRWAQVEKVKHLNLMAEAYCRRHDIDFINLFPHVLGKDGKPKPDIYVDDRLHMNPKGYVIWREVVGPYLR